MRAVIAVCVLAGLLAACGSTRLGDPRAQRLLAMPGPQHYAERAVARELADRCRAFVYDADLADDLTAARSDGIDAVSRLRGGVELEADIKRRSLGARYGGAYETLDPCMILRGELAANTPLSVMVLNR